MPGLLSLQQKGTHSTLKYIETIRKSIVLAEEQPQGEQKLFRDSSREEDTSK